MAFCSSGKLSSIISCAAFFHFSYRETCVTLTGIGRDIIPPNATPITIRI